MHFLIQPGLQGPNLAFEHVSYGEAQQRCIVSTGMRCLSFQLSSGWCLGARRSCAARGVVSFVQFSGGSALLLVVAVIASCDRGALAVL